MGFRQGAYAKVWSFEKGKGNFYIANLSTSRKNKEGNYEKDWGGNVMLVGTAAKEAENGLPDRIKIGDCDVTNRYDKEKKIMYTNYAIYSFQDADAQLAAPAKTAQQRQREVVDVPDGSDDELPFA